MRDDPRIGIVVRTKNEEQWIGKCLSAIFDQDYQNFEVVIVDNNSVDSTVKIAKRFPVKKVVNIEKFLPGLAINLGIAETTGEYISCISAHCIPKNNQWLRKLITNFDDPHVAGVYGRQVPLKYTENVDKRDLLTVFGLDRKIQIKDYFFHNANSMVRRDVLSSIPFDDVVTNVEDRVWGKAVTDKGYKLVYEPEAAVYHYHGLNQSNDASRVKGVTSIIETVDPEVFNDLPNCLRPENTNVAAIIPARQNQIAEDKWRDLLSKCIEKAKNSKFINNIYILSDDESLTENHEVAFLKRDERYNDKLSIEEVVRLALLDVERKEDYPDSCLYLNCEYPFAPKNFYDQLISEAQFNGFDTVFGAIEDYNHIWYENADDTLVRVDSSLQTRDQKKPTYKAVYGLGCYTTAAKIRSGKLIGERVGVVKLNDVLSALRYRNEEEKSLIDTILKLDSFPS